MVQRYGAEHVARVGAILPFQERSAFRAAAFAHGLLAEQVNGLVQELGDDLEGLREGETRSRLAINPLPQWAIAAVQ